MRTLIKVFALFLILALNPCVTSGGDITTDGKFISTESTNPPIAVSSAALVSNLNADQVDGFDASDFVTFTDTASNAALLDGFNSATTLSAAQQIYVSGGDGKLPDDVIDDGSIEDVIRRIFLGCNQLNNGYWANAPSMGNLGLTPALIFALDATPAEAILFSIKVPDDWDGTSGFTFRVFSATLAAEGNVYWFLTSAAQTDDEDVTTGGSLFMHFMMSYASSTLRGLVRSTQATFPGDEIEKGDLLSVMIERKWDMPQDTLEGDAYLLGVEISYTAVR
jgi:hypothetical protein